MTVRALRPGRVARLPALVVTALLAACGTAATDGGAGSDPVAGGPPASRAVVAADLDADGVNDLLTIPLGSEGEPACWRGTSGGALAPHEAWQDHPAVGALKRELARMADHEILADHGVHDLPGTTALSYAVLHLDRPQRDEQPGDPMIDEIRPEAGPAGSLVAIRGHDLAARDEQTGVTFDGAEAEVLVAFPGFVLAIAPDALPLGVGDVVVTRAESASNAVPYEVVEHPTPVVTGVRPDPVSPGVLAVIEGMHLGTLLDDVSVSFSGAEAQRILPLGRLLIAKVPDGAASGLLTVTVNGVTSAGFDIEVAAEQPAPELTDVTPAAASPGSLVEIRGDHLFVIGRRIQVFFGTVRAAIFGLGQGSIVAVVPSGADGDVTVRVGEQSSNGLVFQVLERRLPQIDAVAPDSGEPLDRVDIRGTDLYDLSFLRPDEAPSLRSLLEFSVTFGDARAFLVFPTVEGLHAVVPLRAETGDVVVTVDGKRSNGVPFTVK